MSYSVVNRDFVSQDIQNGINYYKKISPKLAKLFLLRIKEARNQIVENPFADDVMYKGIRMKLLRQFPYHIHYLVIEEEKLIIILAVLFSKMGNLDMSERNP